MLRFTAIIGCVAAQFLIASSCLYEGQIWYGGEILGDPTMEDSWQECGWLCQADENCDAWFYGQSFTFFDTHHKCYKYKFTNYHYHLGNTDGMVAGFKDCPEPVPTEPPTPEPTASPTFVPCKHMDRVWGNAYQIGKTTQATWWKCGEYCESNWECEAWFYYGQMNICWSLKETGGDMYLFHYPNFIAGLSTCPSPCVQNDVYVTGLTVVAESMFSNWRSCRTLCVDNGCKAWNFNVQYGLCSAYQQEGDQQMIIGSANPGQYIAGFPDCTGAEGF